MRLNLNPHELLLLLKTSALREVSSFVAKNKSSPLEIAKTTRLSIRNVRACLEDLRQAGLVNRTGHGLYEAVEPAINLRNKNLDAAVWSAARLAALELYCNGPPLSVSHLGRLIGVTEPTASKAARVLMTARILGKNFESLKDCVDELPRPEHRSITERLRKLLHSEVDDGTMDCVLVAPDRPTQLNLVGVLKDVATAVNATQYVASAAQSLDNVGRIMTSETGATFNITLSRQGDIWNYLWGFVANPSAHTIELLRGLTLYGRRPRRDLTKYFEYQSAVLALTDEKRAAWLARGIIKSTDAEGFSFTPYGILNWRRKVPVETEIAHYKLADRVIDILSSKPARPPPS